MDKVVRRLLLDDACDIGHNESWLGSMAGQGLHLKKYGTMFVHFRRGQPKNTRYRAEILNGKPTQDQISLYREGGWEYVANNRFVAIFAADGNAAVPELHTDPVEQGYTLETACKTARTNFIIMTVCVSIIAILILSVPLFSPQPVYTIITGLALQQFCLLAVELYLWCVVSRSYRILLQLKKSLLAGNPIRHDLPYKTHRTVASIVAFCVLLLALITVAMPVITLVKQGEFVLPQEVDTLPILRLAEVEQSPALVREVNLDQKDFDYGNSVRYEWSLLAPVQYHINESGIIPGIKWADGSGEYTPSLLTSYYELTFPWMSQSFMDDLSSRYNYRQDIQSTTDIPTPLFDEVQLSQHDGGSILAARKGNRIICIRYYGMGSPEKLLPLLADKWSVV